MRFLPEVAGCRQVDPDGIRLMVRLTPNASTDRVDGEEMLADGSHVLKVRVRAIPEKGRANKALIKLLAKAFDVAPSNVSVVKGATTRKKTLRILGEPADLFRRTGVLLDGKQKG